MKKILQFFLLHLLGFVCVVNHGVVYHQQGKSLLVNIYNPHLTLIPYYFRILDQALFFKVSSKTLQRSQNWTDPQGHNTSGSYCLSRL